MQLRKRRLLLLLLLLLRLLPSPPPLQFRRANRLQLLLAAHKRFDRLAARAIHGAHNCKRARVSGGDDPQAEGEGEGGGEHVEDGLDLGRVAAGGGGYNRCRRRR